MTTDISSNGNRARTEGPAPRPRARRRWLVGIAIMLTAGALSFSVAQAHGFGGGPDGGGAWAGHERGGFMAARMARLLDRVGATDGQKAQIKAVWDGLRPQLKAAHEQHRQIRAQMGEAMAAPTIDTARVEQLRRQSVQVMDRTSALITQGMLSSAQVLTPEQRRQVLAEVQKHHQQHGGGDEAP